MAMPSLVIFDFDGTIAKLPIDWPGLKERLLRFLREHGIERTSVTLWKDIGELKQQLPPAVVQEAYRCIEEYEHRAVSLMEVNKHTVAYLNNIIAIGGKIAICSNNMTSTVLMGLERLELRQSVALVVGLDSVRCLKPHPDGVLKILRELRVPARHALFIGDSNLDEYAALSAGVKFANVRTLGGRSTKNGRH